MRGIRGLRGSNVVHLEAGECERLYRIERRGFAVSIKSATLIKYKLAPVLLSISAHSSNNLNSFSCRGSLFMIYDLYVQVSSDTFFSPEPIG